MNGQDDWQARVGRVLDESCEQLDAHTLTRLGHIRQTALQSRSPGRRGLPFLPWWPLAVSLVLVLALPGFWPDGTVPERMPAMLPEEIDILTSEEGPGFYEEFGFYEWLVQYEAD